MNGIAIITPDNAKQFFRFERLTADAPVGAFRCAVPEYAAYLLEDALRSQTARFLTVDADVERDAGVMAFYHKNGFVPNIELSGKRRKTISMRLDLYS